MGAAFVRRGSIWIAMLGLAGCASHASTAGGGADTKLKVSTAPVLRQDMADTLTIFGTIALRQEAFLASQFDGRLSDFTLLLGDRVQKGQQIGTVIPAGREALLQISRDMPAETRPLLEEQIKTIPLFSPLDGVVLEVLHHNGDVIDKGEQVVHIGDLRELDVRGDLPVRDLMAVQKAGRVRVSFTDYPHAPFFLPLEALSGSTSPENQTVVMRLKLANPTGEFRPGMLARLSFPAQNHPGALTIPRPALLEEDGVFSVFVLDGTKVQKRSVQVGIVHDDRVEILTGIVATDRVITEKAYSLEDGMEVSVQ
jgi:multidrug efflux pump subunit AcrA (membrane-fusion protein)